MPLSYNKLDPSAKQIRLLTIFPDENDENLVRASLHAVSLNNACDFEALSYVWGDTSVTVDISVDDCIIGVTANLHAFLRGLRQPDSERTVWVDYVCINQNDISERNSQVPLMCQIYSTATSVIAWLGDLKPEALELIEWYHANQDGDYYNSIYDSKGLHVLEAIALFCLSANALCAAQYWRRLWTFQEWHLSRHAVVCMHGKTTFTIGNIFKRLNTDIVVVRLLANWLTSSQGASIIADTYGTEDLYNASRFLFERQQELDSLVIKIPRDILLLNPDTPRLSRLGDLLLLTVDRHCSNQLDNVYALYGLSPAAREIYPPDYRKTISQVNHETTSFVLGHEANIRILKDFDFCFSSSNRNDSLPSWVVDFTATDPEHRAKMQPNLDFYKAVAMDEVPWKPIQDHAPIITDNM
ncbi:HET domain-containing protein, partial [Aspergillus neoniger CBS 115656]